MIKLYQFPPCWGIPNASIFCLKLETYLKIANIPYTVVTVRDPRKAPKRKLPFIIDNGTVVADSSLIIEYLKKKYPHDLDAHLTQEQKAIALTIQRMIEDHLYWVGIYSRWIDEQNWPVVKEAFFGKNPSFLLTLIANSIRKKMLKALDTHGLGRHQKHEIYEMGRDDLKALAVLIEGPFLFGEKPSSCDALIYALLANTLHPPVESPAKDYAIQQSKFTVLCNTINERYFTKSVS